MTRPEAPRLLAALLLATVTAGACRGAVRSAPRPAPVPAPSAQGDAAAQARAQADSARRPYTAADVHFMTVMIGHHAQAVEMARLAPTRAASAPVQRLAERILSAQQDEIGTMQQWLRDRRKPVPDPSAMHGATHGATGASGSAGAVAGHDHGAMHGGAAMPGMLTPAQLRELEAARGVEFDRLFLKFMIQHHRGATVMVQQLFASHGAGQDETIFKFASDVNVDQETEIARMQRMLRALELEGAVR